MTKSKNFNEDMSIKEILAKMDKSGGNTEIMNAGPCFLQYKLHQNLMEKQAKLHKEMVLEQREFQTKYLNKTNWLVWGTWALVIVTFLLVLISINFPKG